MRGDERKECWVEKNIVLKLWFPSFLFFPETPGVIKNRNAGSQCWKQGDVCQGDNGHNPMVFGILLLLSVEIHHILPLFWLRQTQRLCPNGGSRNAELEPEEVTRRCWIPTQDSALNLLRKYSWYLPSTIRRILYFAPSTPHCRKRGRVAEMANSYCYFPFKFFMIFHVVYNVPSVSIL